MTATIGYVALALMAAMITLAFVAACCAVALAFKFHNEPDEQRVGLRETIFGSEAKGR